MRIGVDPGHSGGLVFVEDWPTASPSDWTVTPVKMPVVTETRKEKGKEVEFTLMPETRAATRKLLSTYHGHDRVLYIEEIPKFAGKARFGKQTVNAASMCVLYGNMSLVMGIALGLGWRVMSLRPQQWQKAVGCENTLKLEKGPWKNQLKQCAQHLFPQIKVTGWNADALLLAVAGIILDPDSAKKVSCVKRWNVRGWAAR